ncbi:MAG: dTDP-glucose 4,6-dehydratase [Candidatus Omnitrophica bacterium]|nr:dTDP-glucose 4,6-dehydratase [Candidatus Omnitrophota bacterium]
MPRWLVTGGAGFIGGHFVRLILRERPGVDVVNLDKLTYAGNEETLEELDRSGRHQWVRGDVADPAAVREAMAGCEAVVHFAAESHVDRSIQDASGFVRTNVLGAYSLFEEARRQKVPRFLNVSTDEVYGSIAESAASEEDPLAPTNPYSATKASGDLLALSYFKTHRFPVHIARSTNNYGPLQYPEKMIPLFITQAIDGEPLPVYGDGRYRRDWLNVEDNARALLCILEKGAPGQIYNVAGGNEWENIEVARSILRWMGRDESLIRHVSDRPGHDRRYAMRDEKVRRLGWAPSIPFEQGLKETVAWYRSHEGWWRNLKRGRVAVP